MQSLSVVDDPEPGGLEAQLQVLYAEREKLAQELGVSDAESLITMVRSMEHQLCALYQEKESSDGTAQ